MTLREIGGIVTGSEKAGSELDFGILISIGGSSTGHPIGNWGDPDAEGSDCLRVSPEVLRGRASFEPGPCHRLEREQIYFLTFVFLVRAAEP